MSDDTTEKPKRTRKTKPAPETLPEGELAAAILALAECKTSAALAAACQALARRVEGQAAPADDVDALLECRAELGVAEARADQAVRRVVELEQQLGAEQRANDEAKAAWSQLDALYMELRDEVSDLLVRAKLVEPAVLHSTADLIKVLRAQRGAS